MQTWDAVDVERLATEIHRDAIIAITHDHRPIGPDLPLMLAGGVTAKTFQLVVDVDIASGYEASQSRTEGWLRLAVEAIEEAIRDIDAHADQCFLARTAADIRRAKEEGRVAILFGTEGTRWLEGSLEPLRLFHRLGLRELQLTWAYPNAVVPETHRLSDFGRAVVAECNRLGLIIDLTHIPEPAFFEVVEASTQPVIVSHGSALGVTVDLDDALLQALASAGGALGVHFYTSYLGVNPTPDDVVKQIDYIANLIGIDHVALGIDFFPTEGAWRKLQLDQGTTNIEWAIPDFSQMPQITRCLAEREYAAQDIHKVLGGNFLRICEEVFGG